MDLAGTRDILSHSGTVPGNPGLSRAIRDTWSPFKGTTLYGGISYFVTPAAGPLVTAYTNSVR